MMLCSRARAHRGVALVLVLWVGLALTVVAIYFAHTARLEYTAAGNNLAGLRAEQAIAGAQRYLIATLDAAGTPGEMPSADDGDYEAENVAVGDARFWIIGRDADADGEPTEPTFGLVDEASKLNLNSATLEMLEALAGITPEVAAAIVDWRDEDSEQTPGGAEAQDYLVLDDPYMAKDSAFETVDELRFVQGVDMRMLYGEDTNRNGLLDPNEDDGDATWPPDDADGRLDPGLAEYVTTFTREPNTRADGTPRVNLRGQGVRQQLSRALSETLGQERATEILATILPQLPRIDSALALFLASGMTEEEFDQVQDLVTTSPGDYRVGAVNVSTAPAAVLACLPGMTAETAEELVEARRGLDTDERLRLTWVTKVLPEETVRLIGPHITTSSYQYSADTMAVGQNDRGFRRVWMVFDREDETRLIYRRDDSRFGNPLATWDGWRTSEVAQQVTQ